MVSVELGIAGFGPGVLGHQDVCLWLPFSDLVALLQSPHLESLSLFVMEQFCPKLQLPHVQQMGCSQSMCSSAFGMSVRNSKQLFVFVLFGLLGRATATPFAFG